MCQYLLGTEIIIGMLETAQHTITEEHTHHNYRELHQINTLDLQWENSHYYSHASQTFHYAAKNCLLS